MAISQLYNNLLGGMNNEKKGKKGGKFKLQFFQRNVGHITLNYLHFCLI